MLDNRSLGRSEHLVAEVDELIFFQRFGEAIGSGGDGEIEA